MTNRLNAETYESRKQLAIAAYESGAIDQGTIGQLLANGMSDFIINRAAEREWITAEFAAQLLNA